jgi:hypothetical protein
VDKGTIEYTFSTGGLFSFQGWTSMNMDGAADEVDLEVPLVLPEGVDNYVMVRASDVAGNERTSIPFRIDVDPTPPAFTAFSPINRTKVDNNIEMVATATIFDQTSGVDTSSIKYRYRVDEDDYSEWIPADGVDEENMTATALIAISGGDSITIQWSAQDIANSGPAISDLIVYSINRPPVVDKLVPSSPHQVYEGNAITFKVRYSDPDMDDVSVTWTMDGEVVSDAAEFEHELPLGKHKVTLLLDDGHGNQVSRKVVVTVEEEPIYISNPMSILPLVIIVVILVLIAAYTVNKRRGEPDDPER